MKRASKLFSAFRSSAMSLGPKLPKKGPIISQTSASFQSALHAATLLTKDSFIQRLYSFSRSNFDPSHSEAACVQLLELAHHRLPHVSPKVLHEHMHLAFASGFYRLGVDLFFLSIQRETQLLMLSEFVVDSAYALLSCSDLLQMASYCAAKCSSAAREREGRRDLFAEILLLRIFWRLVCLYEYISSEECKNQEPTENTVSTTSISSDCEAVFELIQKHFSRESAACELCFTPFFRLTQRLIKYDTSGGDGEMTFYQECLSKKILFPPHIRHQETNNSAECVPSSISGMSTSILATEISEVELFYATLIGTCVSGRHVSVAMSYFGSAKKCVQEYHRLSFKQQVQGANSVPPTISEYVVYRLLSVLQSNKENELIVKIARTLIEEYPFLSISVWSIVLVSAGELRAGDVVLHAYRAAVSQLEFFSGHPQEKRGIEYLLQTTLNALSKCQVDFFEEKYLRACRDAGLLHCTDEFYFSCLLQEAHNSMNPTHRTRIIKERMSREGLPLTGVLVSRFLKIYLRTEDDQYLSMYHHATSVLGVFQRPWIDGLLLWADRRRYSLSQDQRKFILKELRERLGPNAKEHLGGLRTQCALLEYDYFVQPCKQFLEQKTIPDEEPTVQDPRVHFILRRRSSIIRGLLEDDRTDITTPHRFSSWRPLKNELFVLRDYTNLCRQDSLGKVAFLSCKPLVFPHFTNELEEKAFQVFLSDILYGLQVTNNFVD